MQDFRKLDVWTKAHELVLEVYEVTKSLPREEVFGITMQLRRGAAAVPMRIAAAYGRSNTPEKSGDIHKAAASTSELEYAIVLAQDLGYLKAESASKLIEDTTRVRKMLFGFLKTL